MPRPPFDREAFATLLREQDGLFTVAQAAGCGLSSSALNRRAASGAVRTVLPPVYVEGARLLDVRQRIRAAVLSAGDDACLTGAAALHWRRAGRLPDEILAEPVDVLVPYRRSPPDREWRRVTRTRRMPLALAVDGLLVVRTARATVDAATHLVEFETVLDLVCAVVGSGRTSVLELREELTAGPSRGTRLLRLALDEAELIRSVPEAKARALFLAAGLPTPAVNEPIIVNGRRFVPDFRWGRLILEIDSRAWHLLEAGSYEETQRRWAYLRLAGYLVIPVTPTLLRDSPDEVVAMVWAGLAEVAAS
jgi:hypothetical protein